MLKSIFINPVRRGVLGALLAGLIPYAMAASNHGLFLDFNKDGWIFVLLLGGFLALIGFGAAHGGFNRRKNAGDHHRADWSISDGHRHDMSSQNGMHASMRQQWDNQYK